jgi:hypothetical protein
MVSEERRKKREEDLKAVHEAVLKAVHGVDKITRKYYQMTQNPAFPNAREWVEEMNKVVQHLQIPEEFERGLEEIKKISEIPRMLKIEVVYDKHGTGTDPWEPQGIYRHKLRWRELFYKRDGSPLYNKEDFENDKLPHHESTDGSIIVKNMPVPAATVQIEFLPVRENGEEKQFVIVKFNSNSLRILSRTTPPIPLPSVGTGLVELEITESGELPAFSVDFKVAKMVDQSLEYVRKPIKWRATYFHNNEKIGEDSSEGQATLPGIISLRNIPSRATNIQLTVPGYVISKLADQESHADVVNMTPTTLRSLKGEEPYLPLIIEPIPPAIENVEEVVKYANKFLKQAEEDEKVGADQAEWPSKKYPKEELDAILRSVNEFGYFIEEVIDDPELATQYRNAVALLKAWRDAYEPDTSMKEHFIDNYKVRDVTAVLRFVAQILHHARKKEAE